MRLPGYREDNVGFRDLPFAAAALQLCLRAAGPELGGRRRGLLVAATRSIAVDLSVGMM